MLSGVFLSIKLDMDFHGDYEHISLKNAIMSAEGKCLLCGSQDRLVLDHDHVTGKNRGTLCISCNLALGIAEGKSKEKNWLRKAYIYSKMNHYKGFYKDKNKSIGKLKLKGKITIVHGHSLREFTKRNNIIVKKVRKENIKRYNTDQLETIKE